MTKAEKRERLLQVDQALEARYPDALCALDWQGEAWRLMVMGRLSAQCTDARVNLVCRELFAAFPTPKALAEGELSEIERIIRPCGLFRVKAQSIKAACARLVDTYGGIVPDSMDELLTLPGVGRKVANLLLGDLYGNGGIVADTHCIRICGRLGFYPESMKDPARVERILNELTPQERRSDFCHRIVLFGRDICSARAPKCGECPLQAHCSHLQAKK